MTLLSLILTVSIPNLKGQSLLNSADKNILMEQYISRQRDSLEHLYKSTGGDTYWKKDVADTWMSSDDECTWKGVTCNNNKVVSQLNLFRSGLNGRLIIIIFVKEIGSHLNLFDRIQGTIPSELYQLKFLKEIYFQQNRLRGTISTEIGLLYNLRELLIGRNHLNGNIPTEVGNLLKLEIFDVGINSLSGKIPIQIENLMNLELLAINGNDFTEHIKHPTFLCNMNEETGLQILYDCGKCQCCMKCNEIN